MKNLLVLRITASLLIAGLMMSCNKRERVGGACSYDKTIHAAEVIEILPTDSMNSEIELLVNIHEQVDTLSYYIANGGSYASNEEIEKKKIRLGDKLKYVEHQITSGSCSPHFFILKLEKVD